MQAQVPFKCKRDRLSMSGTIHSNATNPVRFSGQSIVNQSAISGSEQGQFMLRQGFIQPILPFNTSNRVREKFEPLLYPNPFKEGFYVQTEKSNHVQFHIYSGLGQLFKTQTSEGTLTYIDMSDAPNGPYFIVAISESKNYTGKILKSQ